MGNRQMGDYPAGTTQRDHDAAFDGTAGVSESAIDERAAELAREDFDAWSDTALDWLTEHAMDSQVDYAIDVIREAVRYMARPELGLYGRGQLDDAVSELRSLYVDAYADSFRSQAIAELTDDAGDES